MEQIYHLTLELTAGIMAAGTVLCWLIPGGLIGLFTENPETVTIGITALHIISLGFILSAVSVTSSGALEALGQGMASLVISVMRYVAVIIPAAFVLSRLIGVTGVWWAFVCTESVTAVVAYVLYHRVWKRADEATTVHIRGRSPRAIRTRGRSPRAIRTRGRSPRAIRTRGRSPRAIRKIASSRLSAATQLPFAHEMALPSSICKSTAFYASVKQHSRNRRVN